MRTSADNPERSLRVALTGFGGLDDAGSGVSVAQALRDGWTGDLGICAWSYASLANGAWLPGAVDRLHVLPALDAGEQQLFEAMVEAHERAAVAALIPAEGDVPVIARLAERLAGHGIRTLLPPLHALEAVSRPNLARFLHERDILAPLTIAVAHLDQVGALAERIGYPVCVRGAQFGERLAYNARQAVKAAQQLNASGQPGVTLQYHAAGDRFSVGLVAGGSAQPPVVVTMRAVALNGEGRVVSGTIVNLPHIESLALQFVEAAQWRGPMTLEMVQPLHGQPLLCDAKPQLPTWCRASHWAGANLAVALLHEMFQLRHKRTRARAGTMFVRGVTESPVALADLLRLQHYGRVERMAPVHLAPRVSKAHKGIVVAITGTSTFDVINPGLGVARSLRDAAKVKSIYGLSYGTLESGSYQPALFDAVFRLPDSGILQALSERLEQIHSAHPIDVLIPCLDGELPLFIQLRDKLDALGIRTLLPDQRALDRRAKRSLFSGRMRADWGEFRIPESRFARSEAETVQAVEAVGLPAVVKGPLFMCLPVTSPAEARWAWNHLASAGWREVIVQRRICGAHYATSVVCDRQHRARSRLTIKKLLVCQRGSTWGAVRVDQPRLEADFSRFLHALRWTGPGEGEFIRDEMTDRFYLIEVNPRFTGWIYYSAALGCNQPAVAVSLALGEALEAQKPLREVAFMRRTAELPLRPSQLAALATRGYLRHA